MGGWSPSSITVLQIIYLNRRPRSKIFIQILCLCFLAVRLVGEAENLLAENHFPELKMNAEEKSPIFFSCSAKCVAVPHLLICKRPGRGREWNLWSSKLESRTTWSLGDGQGLLFQLFLTHLGRAGWKPLVQQQTWWNWLNIVEEKQIEWRHLRMIYAICFYCLLMSLRVGLKSASQTSSDGATGDAGESDVPLKENLRHQHRHRSSKNIFRGLVVFVGADLLLKISCTQLRNWRHFKENDRAELIFGPIVFNMLHLPVLSCI